NRSQTLVTSYTIQYIKKIKPPTRGAILPTKRILGRQEYARQETWGFNHVPEIAMRLNLSIIAALNSPNFVERKEGLIHRSQDSTVTVILSVLSFSSDLRAIKASFNGSIDNCNSTVNPSIMDLNLRKCSKKQKVAHHHRPWHVAMLYTFRNPQTHG
uniref:Uncharacterized protein n=1 Tax=Glossina palpalis gambiensis TaxID=67801 RepID=A0A1B0ASI3_9MUSC